jgi:hypothetical protein
MEISNKNTVPQTSQDMGRQVHNTNLHHSRAHDVADEIVEKHDRHVFKQDLGRRVHNTASSAASGDHGLHDVEGDDGNN